MSEVLSRRDLSDEEVARDCAHQFRRAELSGSASELVRWARSWGWPLVRFVETEGPGEVERLRDRVDELEDDLDAQGYADDDLSRLRELLDELKEAIEDSELTAAARSEELLKLHAKLEREVEDLGKAEA